MPTNPSRSRFAWLAIAATILLVAVPLVAFALVERIPPWSLLVYALGAVALVAGAGALIARHEGRARRGPERLR